jgi:hypothetical protein
MSFQTTRTASSDIRESGTLSSVIEFLHYFNELASLGLPVNWSDRMANFKISELTVPKNIPS